MTRYNNLTPRNAATLIYRSLLDATTAMVTKSYPDLSPDDARYIADLMVRHDKDVIELNGQYRCIGGGE